jgi:type II secretory pathway pseudopilin PulG
VTAGAPSARRSEAGFSLVALFTAITVMMILMAVAMPSWKYVVQNEREQELYFRGNAIAAAIERYQRKNGNAAPPSLEVLVKGKYLRKEYKDPMTKDGKWRLLRPGEVVVARLAAQGGDRRGPRVPQGPGKTGTEIGPFVGVASLSTEDSLRVMNGAETYDEWLFLAGKPRVLGKPMTPVPGSAPSGMPGQPVGGASPGASPQRK